MRSILSNPRYTGRQVWKRQRRDEVLVDVEDVAAGYHSKMRWNETSEWVWSTDETHEAIIDSGTFARAQAQMAAGAYRPTTSPTTRRRTYVLSGRVQCSICGHRMAGNSNHGENHYRSFPRDWAPVNDMDHPAGDGLRPRGGHRAQAGRVDRQSLRSGERQRDLCRAGGRRWQLGG